jgi:hypothetical protein
VTNAPDYHVVSLTYSVKSTEDVTYDAPPPVDFETGEARFHLADAKLVCHMKIHFAAEMEARAVVEPVLRAWERATDLSLGTGKLRFQFESAEVINRTPMPPGRGNIYTLVKGVGALTAIGTVSTHVTLQKYPEPPGEFRITPDVETLWNRYQGYCEGREPLLAMAYFCLTVLKANAVGLPEAAAKYNIGERVLRKLGELTSVRGDARTARKMPTPVTPPLSGAESVWIEEAIKQIIWRTGDQRPLAELPTITMTHLPPL